MTKDTRDPALAYVGDIITAYKAAEKAGRDALGHALECGKHLNAAMKTVTAGKGKWKSWREKNLLGVSEETERLYRRLADAVAQDENFFAECKSIRDAIKHRAKYDDNFVLKPAPTKRASKSGSGSTAAGLDAPEPARSSTDPTVVLQDIDASDIIDNIKGDADKLEEVAARSVAKLTPEKFCDVLKEALAEDQLRELRSLLNTYLSSLHGAPQEDAPARRSSVPHAEFERRV
jgi:hypothetical protein